MADDALLSQLCSICNISPFKYKCPGCSAHTCSLPCYKRHQQWAQCSGKRDPTKFVKKSLLETPAGIDHDFNFLISVERGLQRAEKVENATTGSVSGLQRGANRRNVSNQQLTAAGVTIVRAPQGLSRQKQNTTHRGKSGHIIWTTEWIKDGNSHTFTECSEVETIQRLDPFRSSRKRKRAAADHVSKSDEMQTEARLQSEEHPNEEPPLPPAAQPGGQHTTDGSVIPQPQSIQVAHSDDASPLMHGTTPESLSSKHTFFLLMPRTSSTRKVLIPLDSQATLTDSLRGKTVLEFPTIYVFPESTAPPHETFMMEEAYLQQERDDHTELENALKTVDPETLRKLAAEQGATDENAGGEIDDKAILDVLKRDLGAKAKDL
ncbi:unnamed protein product [Periconia digitata]|uniref:Box C/D snoRNA protein 1 n=1 Tax=Periconia digitata TaxID=1303443 RepID=A0A9W4U1H3_9PLEO|nr:unnamed protein product [Periconia digitata]